MRVVGDCRPIAGPGDRPYLGISGLSTTRENSAHASDLTQFFANISPDPSGFGEGRTFLGFRNVRTDAAGNASFVFVTTTVVPVGQFISATATDPDGNTSEFSNNVPVA